jgi:hypothetical protein
VSGAGGDAPIDCSLGCPADSECVGSLCVVRWGGMPCTSSDDCPSWATCCDGSKESCDGTRVPPGDGTLPGQLVVAPDGLTVDDMITGLVWQRDGAGLRPGCTGSGSRTCTWNEANAYCGSLVLGGIEGWRLPGEREIITIEDFTRAQPSIDPSTFPGLEGLSLSDASWESSLPLWTSSTSTGCPRPTCSKSCPRP